MTTQMSPDVQAWDDKDKAQKARVAGPRTAYQEAAALAARLKQELVEMTTICYVAYANGAGEGTIVALTPEFEPEFVEPFHSIGFSQGYPYFVSIGIGNEFDEGKEIRVEDHSVPFLSKTVFWGYDHNQRMYKAASSRALLEEWLATSAREEWQEEMKPFQPAARSPARR